MCQCAMGSDNLYGTECYFTVPDYVNANANLLYSKYNIRLKTANSDN